MEQNNGRKLSTQLKVQISAIKALLKRFPTEPSTPQHQSKKNTITVDGGKVKQLMNSNERLLKQNKKMKKMLKNEIIERRSLKSQIQHQSRLLNTLSSSSQKSNLSTRRRSDQISFCGFQESFRGNSFIRTESQIFEEKNIRGRRMDTLNENLNLNRSSNRVFQDTKARQRQKQIHQLEDLLTSLLQKSHSQQNRAKKLRIRNQMSKICSKIRTLKNLNN